MAGDSTEDTIMIAVLIVIAILLVLYFMISTGIIKFQLIPSMRIV